MADNKDVDYLSVCALKKGKLSLASEGFLIVIVLILHIVR